MDIAAVLVSTEGGGLVQFFVRGFVILVAVIAAAFVAVFMVAALLLGGAAAVWQRVRGRSFDDAPEDSP